MRKVITEIHYTTERITYGKELLALIMAQKRKEESRENKSCGKES